MPRDLSQNRSALLSEKARAQRLRLRLRRHDLYLAKCRSRTTDVPGYGGYWVVSDDNAVVFGAHPYAFSASLDDIERWLEEK